MQSQAREQIRPELQQQVSAGPADPASHAKKAQNGRTRPAKKQQQAGYGSIHRLEDVGNAPSPRAAQRGKSADKPPKKKVQPLDRKKLLAYLIAGVAAVGLLLSGYFVFLLEHIEVDGNEQYSDQSIIELSGLKAGRHMLLCDLNEAKVSIGTNAYLKVVSVKRELPRTIRITVQERQEIAAIVSQGYDVIIDKEGYVLSIGAGSDLSGLLRITGMSQLGFEVNAPIGTRSDFQTQTLLTMIEQLMAFELFDDVSELDLSNPLRVCLYTDEGITVVIGQAENLSDKLAWMRDALPSLRTGGITEGTLDVSAKGGAIFSPDKIIKTPQENPEQEAPSNEDPAEDPADPDDPGDDTADPGGTSG